MMCNFSRLLCKDETNFFSVFPFLFQRDESGGEMASRVQTGSEWMKMKWLPAKPLLVIKKTKKEIFKKILASFEKYSQTKSSFSATFTITSIKNKQINFNKNSFFQVLQST